MLLCVFFLGRVAASCWAADDGITVVPRLHLADIRLDDIPLDQAPLYPDRFLGVSWNEATLTLPPGFQPVVALHLTALEPRVYVTSRLLGLDSQPIRMEEGERILRFPRLPVGEHALEVRAFLPVANGPDVLVAGADWQLRVPPPFWATEILLWTYGLLGLGLAVCGGLWLKQRRRAAAQLNREVRQAEAQKLESLSTLAGGIAHDFNNLLVGILGHAELARMELESGSRLDTYLERIEESADRAADLSRQMLFYSGRGSFQVKPLSLSTIVEDTLSELEGGLGSNARLLREIERHIPSVEGDAAQLKQLVRNLVLNAVEALGSGQGMVVVATGFMFRRADAKDRDSLPTGNYVFLTVDDTGCGVAKADLDRIFDPFFSTKSPGRGLGLAVAQGIVRGHGGRMSVSSTEGHGATFRVLFPALERGRPAPPPPEPVQPEIRAGHVLVVDDELGVRRVAARHLERMGFEVVSVGTGEDGLEHVRRGPDDIAWILMDISMPGMGGLAAAREIRRFDPSLPIVLTSGFSREDALVGNEGIADGFIEKPYRFEELERQLQALGLVPSARR